MQHGPRVNHIPNLNTQEINKFSALADKWWDINGPSAALHTINPCRLQYVLSHAQLKNKQVLDVGCGAGILTESLADQGANVIGIDPSAEMIKIADEHANNSLLDIEYKCIVIEELIESHNASFDIITCMELLEHVPNPAQLIDCCSKLLKPGGKIFFSTLNRNLKSYALAIVGAEYILNILPKQTHDYAKFIRPAELTQMLCQANLQLNDLTGINYNPLYKHATLCSDVSVNYLAFAIKVG